MYLYLRANNAHVGGETLVRSSLSFFSVLQIKAISFATGLAAVPWNDRIRVASRAADYKRQRRGESRSLSQILKGGWCRTSSQLANRLHRMVEAKRKETVRG